MVFSSLTFWYIYLPCVLLIYYIVPKKARNVVLFLVSLAFYGWGEPFYIILMLLTIALNYVCGLLVAGSTTKSKRKVTLIVSVILNLSLLVFFKYAGMIINTVNLIPAVNIAFEPPALPIGISFYTFQAMSYTIDVYRDQTEKQKNPLLLGTYVTLFPQLIAGPIVRYKDVADQLTGRRETMSMFKHGVIEFLVGLAKKVLLANRFALMWDNLCSAGAENGILGGWAGLAALSLQIYFDFSGYSDMARGLGNMLGFRFMKNFDYPYISRSITEFWRRWHISLSTWFRDYLYIPLGGNRCGIARQIFNLFVVWLLTGLWHGAAYNFMLWGLYFFVILVAEKLFLGKLLKKTPAAFGHIYAIILIMLGWAIFNFEDLGELWGFVCGLFTPATGTVAANAASITLSYLPMLIIGCVLSTPVLRILYRRVCNMRFFWIAETVMCVVCVVLCTAALVSDSFNPFIYFRF